MVRLLVEEARPCSAPAERRSRERDDRFSISTSTASAPPRSGFVHRPAISGTSETRLVVGGFKCVNEIL